jgi:hypothetical protein
MRRPDTKSRILSVVSITTACEKATRAAEEPLDPVFIITK